VDEILSVAEPQPHLCHLSLAFASLLASVLDLFESNRPAVDAGDRGDSPKKEKMTVIQVILAAAAVLLGTTFVKRRYFSPLSNIPGPIVASFSASLWHLWHIYTGHVEEAVIKQHKKHGS